MQLPAETASEPVAPEVSRREGRCAPVTVGGHELTVFSECTPLIEQMVADIRTATTRAWMESYIFVDDAAGRAVVDALTERAAAGVDVRLMIDGWGSLRTKNAQFDRLRDAGGQVHVFHALREALRGPRSFLRVLNQRNHRKLLVIDNKLAYFGGMNIVDLSGIYSRADAKERKLPASAGWRDVHVRMMGPKQAEVADAMDRVWRREHGAKVREPGWPVEEALASDQEGIYFFSSYPTYRRHRPHRIIVPLIQQARRQVMMAVAYFVPPSSVRRALFRVRKRGARVSIVMPMQSDVPVVQWAARHFYEYLLKRGFEIYERRDRMLHSKAIVIDDSLSLVGSCNLDARSLRINLEFLGVVRGRPFAECLSDICREEIQESVRIDEAYCARYHFGQRLLHRVAWMFRKWL